MKDEEDVLTSYNTGAEHYHEQRTTKYPEGWFFNELLEMPATLKLLGNVKGKRLLDFGCGTGIYAKLLTRMGANVSGFDISSEMLAIAKKENPSLDLKLGSGYKIPFREKFDIVQASLVLDHVKYWNRALAEVHKVLKNDGTFVFSVGNPVAETAKSIKFMGKKYRVLGIRDYFLEHVSYNRWKIDGKNVRSVSVPFYHKTYETIIRTVVKNGFEIVDYRDAFPLKKAEKLFPEYYKRYSKIPFFSVWKLKKQKRHFSYE